MTPPHLAGRFLRDLIRLTLTDTPFPALREAEALLLGTAAVESGWRNVRQQGNGAARGVWQMEPATAREHDAYLRQHRDFQGLLEQRCGVARFAVVALEHNLLYQLLLARTHYWRRDPLPIPDAADVVAQSRRWKTWYNTPAGKGTEAQYQAAWEQFVAPLMRGRRPRRHHDA